MSGIAGIFNLQEVPLSDSLLETLGEALNSRGPDGGSEINCGTHGMAYRAFHTNTGSRLEEQPLLAPPGHLLVWDGRLDNRDDLLLHFPDGLDGNKTDVALVMAAYLKWGREFLSSVVGDFVLSLYDPKSRAILLARDPFGTRTLYYTSDKRRIVWSSTLEALLTTTGIEPEVDDEYIAGYLALHPEMFRTPYKNIFAVIPGHMLMVDGNGLRSRSFWKLDPKHEVRYENDAEYEEKFRQLFHDAVKCRLNSDGPVWAELSGGLDSSSIVCMADRIMRAGQVSTPRLETVSYIDENSTTFFDRKFISLVENMRGGAGQHLQSNRHWVSFVSPEQLFISKPSTALCVVGTHQWLSRVMEADRARVLLSGLGGDQLLWSIAEPAPQLTDLVFQHRPVLLHRRLQEWSQFLKQPYLLLLWQEAIVPLLPTSLRVILQGQLKPAPWLTRDFIKACRIKDRLLLPADPFGYRIPSNRLQSSLVQFIISSIAEGECWEQSSADKTYPFLHRPLVEFLMAIPFDQKLRVNETRSLMRRAFKDLLPPKILNRKSKGIVGETFCRGVADQWCVLQPMLVDARVCRRGYVDEKVFRSVLDLARHGRKIESSTLFKTIALEIWLRSLEHYRVPSREALRSRNKALRVSLESRAGAVATC